MFHQSQSQPKHLSSAFYHTRGCGASLPINLQLQPVAYEFGQLSLSLPETVRLYSLEADLFFRIKPEIQHTFRSGESTPILMPPVVFSVLSTLPFICLLSILLSLVLLFD
jgi:hypothetical protein